MFHVGQLVVCVDDTPAKWNTVCTVKRGHVYTVAAVRGTPDPAGSCGVRVSEAMARSRLGRDWFRADRFRPLSDTRIAIFRQMLAPTPTERETA